jgi:hypothetical protein
MHAVISATEHDFYAFPLPITAYSWNRIGVKCIIFIPDNYGPKLELAEKYCNENIFVEFHAPEHKIPTYAQVSRLFGCCLDLPDDEVLITGDADLPVFGDYLLQANDKQVHVFGADLVTGNQFPMCYLSATVKQWRSIMWAPFGFGYQFYLNELLGPIECEHFRANQWCFDQNLAFENFSKANFPVIRHNRANAPHQFATRRADRDGWPNQISPDIIDAHLPRPGYTEENFAKILNLFQTVYRSEDFQWIIDYRNEYIKLIE